MKSPRITCHTSHLGSVYKNILLLDSNMNQVPPQSLFQQVMSCLSLSDVSKRIITTVKHYKDFVVVLSSLPRQHRPLNSCGSYNMSDAHQFKPVTLTGQENFTRWYREFKIAAQAQGVWSLFTGDESVPSPPKRPVRLDVTKYVTKTRIDDAEKAYIEQVLKEAMNTYQIDV
jgi:hypothetical protein